MKLLYMKSNRRIVLLYEMLRRKFYRLISVKTEFLLFLQIILKSSFRPFPYRAYAFHKNDSLNPTQKVLWSIKGLVVNLSILFR